MQVMILHKPIEPTEHHSNFAMERQMKEPFASETLSSTPAPEAPPCLDTPLQNPKENKQELDDEEEAKYQELVPSNWYFLSSQNPSETPQTTHAKLRVFTCNYCQREFTTFQALGGHRNSHKKDRTPEKRRQRLGTPIMDSTMAFERPSLHHHGQYSSTASLPFRGAFSISHGIQPALLPCQPKITELGECSRSSGTSPPPNHENNIGTLDLAYGSGGTGMHELTPRESSPGAMQPADHDVFIEMNGMAPGERAQATDCARVPFQETALKIEGLHPRADIQDQTSDQSPKLGEMFFPFTVQASLSIMTGYFSSSSLSSSNEVKLLLRAAAGSNMLGYICCLIEMLLHRTKPKAAKIVERIGSAAAVFGYLSMMCTFFPLDPMWIIGLASVVSFLFFAASSMM